MSEPTGLRPISDMTDKEIDKEIDKLLKFEAHVSDLAYLRLSNLRKEKNYRKTKSGSY